MSKSTLRNVIDEAVERAFIAGAEWILVWHNGIGSPEAERTVKKIRQSRPAAELPLIQQGARESIARAIMEAAIAQTTAEQARLF